MTVFDFASGIDIRGIFAALSASCSAMTVEFDLFRALRLGSSITGDSSSISNTLVWLGVEEASRWITDCPRVRMFGVPVSCLAALPLTMRLYEVPPPLFFGCGGCVIFLFTPRPAG